MSPDYREPRGRVRRICEILLAYLESTERGHRPDPAGLLARHPDVAAELREFLEAHQRLEQLTAALGRAGRPRTDHARPTATAYSGR
jgi:hypothetical protein